MPNEVLSPAVVSASAYPMPTFDNRAYPVQSAELAGSFYSSPSVANGSSFSASGLIGAGAGLLNGFLDRRFERKEAQRQRDWNESMLEKENQWNLDLWNRTNEYNSPAAQVERMREAGLNPLYYGLDGSSANGVQSAQSLGYDRASARGLTNPFNAGLEGYMSMKSLDKDIELKNAQIDKIKNESASVGLDNEFKDKTLAARVEAENLGNQLTKENIDKVKKEKNQIEENIKKTIQETKSEVERTALLAAQTAVQKATEKQILELLPYQKLLVQAQTAAQKAAASASYWNAMYQKGLIDRGYLDAVVEKAKSDSRDAASRAAIDDWKNAVKHGYIFDVSEISKWNPEYWLKSGFNGLFNATSIVAEAIAGPLAGLIK